jgi:ligand-binding sensor domain-containing protein
MKNSIKHGVDKENLGRLTAVVEEHTQDLRFTPGSRSRVVISREDLELLVRGARDGLVAHDLHAGAVLAEQELSSLGYRTDIVMALGGAISNYLDLHPETNAASKPGQL